MSANGQIVLSQIDDPNPEELVGLLDEWDSVEKQFSDHLMNNDANLIAQQSGNLAILTDEEKLAALEAEQQQLLNNIVASEATTLPEVLRKLEIWQATTCPSPEDEAFLQPVDQLVLSVISDLNKLLA